MTHSAHRAVWKLPVLSQDIETGPRLHWHYADLLISYDVLDVTGDLKWYDMVFPNAIAYMFVSLDHCILEQVKAYDQLVEVSNSRWLPTMKRVPEGVKHFRIFFDDIGTFEIAAPTFVPPPPTASTNDVET